MPVVVLRYVKGYSLGPRIEGESLNIIRTPQITRIITSNQQEIRGKKIWVKSADLKINERGRPDSLTYNGRPARQSKYRISGWFEII